MWSDNRKFQVHDYTFIGIYQNINFINSNIFRVKIFLLHIDVNYWHVSQSAIIMKPE
jgi:hypothetical protein